MKSCFIFIFLLAPCFGYSQEPSKINLVDLCQDSNSSADSKISDQTSTDASQDNDNLIIVDQGFCAEYLKLESEATVTSMVVQLGKKIDLMNIEHCSTCDIDKTSAGDYVQKVPSINPPIKDKWKIRFYASHSFTTYFNSDITFKSSRYSVEIKDYEWAERGNRNFFTAAEYKNNPKSNPLQMIDEPTNTFTLSLEKNGHEFFISAFHPKYLQKDEQVKHIKGVIDGVAVDSYQSVRKFDGTASEPGTSQLLTNQNTHKQMSFEMGYGHRFTLFNTKYASMSFIPSVGLGVMVGENKSGYVKKGTLWEWDSYKDSQYFQGFGGSVAGRVELNTWKDRIGIFYESKLGFYHLEHGFLDGTQSYNLGFNGNSVGIKVMLYNPNNWKKRDKSNKK
jgi:hypothetical protein